MTPQVWKNDSARRVAAVLIAALICAPLVPTRDAEGATGRYQFKRVQKNGSLGAFTRTWGAAWLDHDGDGDPDVFLNRHQFNPWLLERRGRTFQIAYDGIFRQPDRHNCAWGEANGDGEADLYCTVGAQRGVGEGPNQLFIKTPSGYEDRAEALGVTNHKGRGRSINWIDYDGDGDLDIFLGNRERPISPAAMYRNDDDGTFRRADTGIEEPDISNSTWADWDNDRDPDMLLLPGSSPPIAYENHGGTFTRVEIFPITSRLWKSAAWGDYNGDGWIDLHLVRRKRAIVLRNDSGTFRTVDTHPLTNGRMSEWLDIENDGDLDLFVVKGATGLYPEPEAENYADLALLNRGGRFDPLRDPVLQGASRGSGDTATVTDYDRDGRTDILVTNGYQASRGPLWLIHNLSISGRWIGIDLVGPASNPLGYGTRIIVTTNTRTFRRQMTDGVGYRSQSEVGYTAFGLRDARSARIEIVWPDETTSCYSSSTNRVIRAVHGSAPCA